jgi:hypothetical protein
MQRLTSLALALVLALVCIAPSRAQLTSSQVSSDINSQLPTTGSGAISAATLRNLLHEMATATFQSQGASGLSISGTPSAGQVPIATGPTSAVWGPASATPGGSSGQLQYNNAGAFGGVPAVNGDGTLNTGTGALAINKGTTSVFGIVKADGSSILSSGGVLSAVGGGGGGTGILQVFADNSTLGMATLGMGVTDILTINARGQTSCPLWYHVSNSQTNQPGEIANVPGSVWLEAQYAKSPVLACQFGAYGNTDDNPPDPTLIASDTVALQAAVDFAYSFNDGTHKFPQSVACQTGSYFTNAPLFLDAPHNLRGQSTDSTYAVEGTWTNYAPAWDASKSYFKYASNLTPIWNTITSLSWTMGGGGTVTVQTSAPHGLTGTTGLMIIAGATPSQYNGVVTATVTDATHFTYPLAMDPGMFGGSPRWVPVSYVTRNGVPWKSLVDDNANNDPANDLKLRGVETYWKQTTTTSDNNIGGGGHISFQGPRNNGVDRHPCNIYPYYSNGVAVYAGINNGQALGNIHVQGQRANYHSQFQGYISGTTLTVTSAPSDIIFNGALIFDSGIADNTHIYSNGTGTGGTGTYTIDVSQTVGSMGSPVTIESELQVLGNGALAKGSVGVCIGSGQGGANVTVLEDMAVVGFRDGVVAGCNDDPRSGALAAENTLRNVFMENCWRCYVTGETQADINRLLNSDFYGTNAIVATNGPDVYAWGVDTAVSANHNAFIPITAFSASVQKNGIENAGAYTYSFEATLGSDDYLAQCAINALNGDCVYDAWTLPTKHFGPVPFEMVPDVTQTGTAIISVGANATITWSTLGDIRQLSNGARFICNPINGGVGVTSVLPSVGGMAMDGRVFYVTDYGGHGSASHFSTTWGGSNATTTGSSSGLQQCKSFGYDYQTHVATLRTPVEWGAQWFGLQNGTNDATAGTDIAAEILAPAAQNGVTGIYANEVITTFTGQSFDVTGMHMEQDGACSRFLDLKSTFGGARGSRFSGIRWNSDPGGSQRGGQYPTSWCQQSWPFVRLGPNSSPVTWEAGGFAGNENPPIFAFAAPNSFRYENPESGSLNNPSLWTSFYASIVGFPLNGSNPPSYTNLYSTGRGAGYWGQNLFRPNAFDWNFYNANNPTVGYFAQPGVMVPLDASVYTNNYHSIPSNGTPHAITYLGMSPTINWTGVGVGAGALVQGAPVVLAGSGIDTNFAVCTALLPCYAKNVMNDSFEVSRTAINGSPGSSISSSAGSSGSPTAFIPVNMSGLLFAPLAGPNTYLTNDVGATAPLKIIHSGHTMSSWGRPITRNDIGSFGCQFKGQTFLLFCDHNTLRYLYNGQHLDLDYDNANSLGSTPVEVVGVTRNLVLYQNTATITVGMSDDIQWAGAVAAGLTRGMTFTTTGGSPGPTISCNPCYIDTVTGGSPDSFTLVDGNGAAATASGGSGTITGYAWWEGYANVKQITTFMGLTPGVKTTTYNLPEGLGQPPYSFDEH